MVRGGRLRIRSRISGWLIDHLGKDVEHIHEDIEHVIKAHTEPEVSEVKEHLEEVAEHLHDLMVHSKELREALPLAFLSEGEEGEIADVRGGRGMIQRLSDMGFTPSTKIRVLKSNPAGPMLVDVRDARIALGRGVAMKIIVNGIKKR